MISHVLGLTRWEWFKIRRRWLPWILLAIAILISQVILWGFYAAFHLTDGSIGDLIPPYEYASNQGVIEVTCEELLQGDVVEQKVSGLSPQEQDDFFTGLHEWTPSCEGYTTTDESRAFFTLPVSAALSLFMLFSFETGAFGIILLLILTASAMGSEYGWGTLRASIASGPGRAQFLASKMLAMVFIGVGAILAIVLITTLTSLLALLIPPAESGSIFLAGEWGNAFVFLGKTIYAIIPFVAIATFLTILTQSSAAGIGLSLGYLIVEWLVLPPILRINDTFEKINEGLLNQNVIEWMFAGNTQAAETLDIARTPDTLQGFLVILAYTAVFTAAAFWLFLRRDITGAKGS